MGCVCTLNCTTKDGVVGASADSRTHAGILLRSTGMIHDIIMTTMMYVASLMVTVMSNLTSLTKDGRVGALRQS